MMRTRERGGGRRRGSSEVGATGGGVSCPPRVVHLSPPVSQVCHRREGPTSRIDLMEWTRAASTEPPSATAIAAVLASPRPVQA
jgi:hypothetical protein